MVPTAWIYSIQFGFCFPQLHQHLYSHSTCHLSNKTYPLTPDCIDTCESCTGFWNHAASTNKCLHHYVYMLPFIPLHFLCTHFWQLVQCIELLPTPLPHTLSGHLTAFCINFCHSPLIITLVLFICTLMPLFSMKSFHSISLLIRSSSISRAGEVVEALLDRKVDYHHLTHLSLKCFRATKLP